MVTGHLSEGSFVRNGVVQIPKFLVLLVRVWLRVDANSNPTPIHFGRMTLRTSELYCPLAHQRRPCTLTALAPCRLSASAAIDHIGGCIQVMTSDQLVKPIMSVILNALTLSRPALSAIITNCCKLASKYNAERGKQRRCGQYGM